MWRWPALLLLAGCLRVPPPGEPWKRTGVRGVVRTHLVFPLVGIDASAAKGGHATVGLEATTFFGGAYALGVVSRGYLRPDAPSWYVVGSGSVFLTIASFDAVAALGVGWERGKGFVEVGARAYHDLVADHGWHAYIAPIPVEPWLAFGWRQ
jgi:hypothetical protein